MTKKVAMIGVGKLGEPCATVMSQYYDVVGYDLEPRTPAFPMKSTIEEAVQDRDFIFIAAPTPHDPVYGGETPTSHLAPKDFDYSITAEILKEVNKHVNKNQLVILISTVLPGTVRNRLHKYITNARFIYNPYLIAMGTVAWDFVNPEMVIIGTQDGSITGDAKELIEFYKPMMENNPRYEVGTWDEAESIKIFYNTFISTKLALVNMIQDVAEKNGNMNVDVVTNALAKSTHRITGPAYMTAGMGDAGACHPRDNIALRHLANRLDLGYDLFDSIMTAREIQAKNIAKKCLEYGNKITIVGKAYKPAVPYTNGSCSLLVGYYLEELGAEVNYYDIHTKDLNLRTDWTEVYMIGYWEDYVEKIDFPADATIVDPWRRFEKQTHQGEIVHYGNTRIDKSVKADTPDDSFETTGNQIAVEKLTGGITISYPRKLDGGGVSFLPSLIQTIKRAGKICNHITFSDCYQPAIDNCLKTAKENNVEHYVSSYHTDKIANIPYAEKWDLVISNPPHCSNLSAFLQSMSDCKDQGALDNATRLCVDHDLKIHQEFFDNIGNYLNHYADIFLIEESRNNLIIDMATRNKEHKYKLQGAYPMQSGHMPNGHILHFRYLEQ